MLNSLRLASTFRDVSAAEGASGTGMTFRAKRSAEYSGASLNEASAQITFKLFSHRIT